MHVIAIETSQRNGTLAALNADGAKIELACAKGLPGDQRTAESLIPKLQELLEDCGWNARDLDLVCTTTGPGSFTGLRLGVTTAKTLAYASGAELVGVSTLAAIAAGVPAEYERLWTIVDAQRQELFATCFTAGWQSKRMEDQAVHVLSIEHWLKQLRAGDLVAGSALNKIGVPLPPDVTAVDSQYRSPQAATVGSLGIEAKHLGQTVDPMQLVPKYYRKSAAEEKLQALDS